MFFFLRPYGWVGVLCVWLEHDHRNHRYRNTTTALVCWVCASVSHVCVCVVHSPAALPHSWNYYYHYYYKHPELPLVCLGHFNLGNPLSRVQRPPHWDTQTHIDSSGRTTLHSRLPENECVRETVSGYICRPAFRWRPQHKRMSHTTVHFTHSIPFRKTKQKHTHPVRVFGAHFFFFFC